MHASYPVLSRTRMAQVLVIGLLLSIMLMVSACGGDPKVQQQSSSTRAQVEQLLAHAQQIGIPAAQLKPLIAQEKQLSSASAPFSLFNDLPITEFYNKQNQQYQTLLTKTQDLITNTTNQLELQAENDMQNFQNALSRRSSQHIGNLKPFSDQYAKDQVLLNSAKYPKDFMTIGNDAQVQANALGLMGLSYVHLTSFKTTIHQMQQAHIDVTAMQSQYDTDMQSFNGSVSVQDFTNLDTIINAQYQQAVVASIGSVPYVGAAKLGEFKSQINLLKTYGMDPTSYQARYAADQKAINNATNIKDYLAFSKQIDSDIASMHDDLMQGASHYLVGSLDREALKWGNAHLYHNKYDGKNYLLDSGYDLNDGIGYWLNRELGWSYTPDDYQAVVNDENTEFFNLHMMEINYNDHTPYNKPHATDKQLLSHYNLHGQTIVVSFTEQALRLYQGTKLVRAFHVTTGRVERPSLPGVWTVQDRKAPTVFKSTEPKGSPYWYPDTPIHYAILYHWGGFFLHDAWWRVDYGPGTQFPHYDSGGDESFSGNGSHGCVNIQEDEAAWLFGNTSWNTNIVIY